MNSKVFFDGIEDQVLNYIASADNNIRAAIAWFTSIAIYDGLIDASERGVVIEIILIDDEINNNSELDFEYLEEANVKIHWYSKEHNGLMHHKFCIIDDITVLSGSYNWTVNAAKRNRENITITTEKSFAKEFVKEFLYIRDYLNQNSKPKLSRSKENNRKDQLNLKYGFSYIIKYKDIRYFTLIDSEDEPTMDDLVNAWDNARSIEEDDDEAVFEEHFLVILKDHHSRKYFKVSLRDFLNSIESIEFDDENKIKFDIMKISGEDGEYNDMRFYAEKSIERKWECVGDDEMY